MVEGITRHILYELHKSGAKPEFCITAQHFPPKNNQDLQIACQITEKLGLKQVIVDQPGSRVIAELKKNILTGFCSDEHAQYLAIIEFLKGQSLQLYDGIGGDVLSAGIYYDDQQLFEDGKLMALADQIFRRFSGCLKSDELELKHLLTADSHILLSREKAITRLLKELEKHQEAPNPVTSFYFWNRIRREIALYTYALWPDPSLVCCPYLDYELYDFLASLPPHLLADGSFHTETIHRAFPEYSQIPFEHKTTVNDTEYFRRFSGEFLSYILKKPDSKLINLQNVLVSLAHCSKDGAQKHIGWMNPSRVLFFIQLERLKADKVFTIRDQLNEIDLMNLDRMEESGDRLQKFLNKNNESIFERRWLDEKKKVYQELSFIIPPATNFILVDEEQLNARDEWKKWTIECFIQKNNIYFGPPANDDTAINELERLCQLGAIYIVIAWPAFWWLDYYKKWHQYLLSNYRCILENERLVVFDLWGTI